MRILTRYILKEMIGPTLLGFAFYTSILLMQQLFNMAGLIIRGSLPGRDVAKLLLLAMPHIVVLTLPMSLLFGILIAVGRLSSDSEIIAMRALGISMRQIYRPVLLFSFVLFFLNLYLMNYVLPYGNRQLQALRAEIVTSSVETEVKPRVFYDEYEGLMIYVNDVDPQTGRWKGVFVADTRSEDAEAESDEPQTAADAVRQPVTAPSDDGRGEAAGALGTGGGQRIVVASTGHLSVLKPSNQIWMNLEDARTHFWNPSDVERYDLNRNKTQRILLPSAEEVGMQTNALAKSLKELNLRELLEQEKSLRGISTERTTYNLARVEIHKKFAIPFACIAFGVLGLPLGITNRRGGKSSGFSLSIAIILFYYVMISNGEQLAAVGKLPPAVAMWGADLILLVLGFYLLARANRDAGAQKSEGGLVVKFLALFRRRERMADARPATGEEPSLLNRLDITFPNILDRYILREFLKILGMVLISVVALFIVVDYTEIARDVRQNNIRIHTLLYYYRFLIFNVLHQTIPISVLVATLVTFGMLSKNNEVTAIKANGVSLYRVAVPIVVVAILFSLLAYFLLDFILPYSQQRVYDLKRKIDGKPPITAAAQHKLWYHGQGRYIINFLSYDEGRQELTQVQVFEFHPTEFRLTRRVWARTAKWNGQAWAFENGWMRSFTDDGTTTYTPITRPIALYYSERPEDFAAEVKPPDQMTFAQLRRYIDAVRRSGYNADELSVKLYTKTSWPAISIVMALIALPFAFRMGRRGTLYGVGIALVVGIVYWMIFGVFTKFGEVGNLPPILSAWAANILFAIAAIYMFLHVET